MFDIISSVGGPGLQLDSTRKKKTYPPLRWFLKYIFTSLWYWRQRAAERLSNPQGNQEPLGDKVEKPQVRSGWAVPWNVTNFLSSVVWSCWLGALPVKTWVLVCWLWWFAKMELCTTYDSSFQSSFVPIKSRM